MFIRRWILALAIFTGVRVSSSHIPDKYPIEVSRSKIAINRLTRIKHINQAVQLPIDVNRMLKISITTSSFKYIYATRFLTYGYRINFIHLTRAIALFSGWHEENDLFVWVYPSPSLPSRIHYRSDPQFMGFPLK